MSKLLLVTVVALFIFSLSVSSTSSHGLGQILRKETDKYFIELEYEALELTEDEPVEYAFRLLDKSASLPVEFDSVGVRIADTKTNSGIFSAIINPSGAFLLGPRVYIKLDKGNYSVKTSFIKKDEKIAEESFNLTVLAGERKNRDFIPVGLGFLAGAVVSAFGVALYLKKRK